MPLKAGNVNESKPPTPDDRSMAQAIEQAFREQWPLVMGDRELPEDNPQTKLFFAAIARGIVAHLVQHPEAFQVTVTLPDNTTATGTVTAIDAARTEDEELR